MSDDCDLYFIADARPSPYIRRGQAFTLNDFQFPPNWLTLADQDDLAGIGAQPVVSEGRHGDPRLVDNGEEFDGPLRRLTAVPKAAEQVHAALLAYLADRRWRAEVGGITWNGWPVATDRESQAKIAQAYQLARDGHWSEAAGWKFTDGVYRVLTPGQAQELALAVATHVQACFALEDQVAAQVLAGAVTDFAAIDGAFPSPQEP